MTTEKQNNESLDRRIAKRENEIVSEVSQLESKINHYTTLAWIFVWVGVIVGLLSIIYYSCVATDGGFTLNLLGDFLGGSVASLWALAGLLLIYVAFLGQRQQILNQQLEILYSQQELRYTRQEIAGQREELRGQNETLKQQRFENIFFELIKLHRSNIETSKLYSQKISQEIQGQECFKDIHQDLRLNFERCGRNAIKAYESTYRKREFLLSHYFRTLYHIFKFIDNADIENKNQYAAIIRAQLSNYEQALLFYNCLHDNGREKFKPLIEKYAVFNNFDFDLLIDPAHRNEYSENAYGSID